MIRREKGEATQAPHVPPETEQQPLAFARECQANNSCGERERERETFGLLIVWDHDVTREVKPVQASA